MTRSSGFGKYPKGKGLYHKMSTSGNTVKYNRQDFTVDNLKDVFGQLFYGKGFQRDELYTPELEKIVVEEIDWSKDTYIII